MSNKIFEGAKGALNKLGFTVKKHSPAILMTVGIGGVIGGAVMACISTTKVSRVLAAREEQLSSVDMVLNDENKTEVYTEEDARRDRLTINIQSGAKLVLLYAPAVAVEFGAIACILASHGIMKKRNAALSAAYMAGSRVIANAWLISSAPTLSVILLLIFLRRKLISLKKIPIPARRRNLKRPLGRYPRVWAEVPMP